MSLHSTHGYDMVLVFNELGLTEALAHTILEQPILEGDTEGDLDLPVDLGGPISFRWEAVSDPDAPNTLDFDSYLENGVRLSFAYIMNLAAEAGSFGFSGRVRIAAPLRIRSDGNRQSVVLDFRYYGVSPENIEVEIDSLPERLTGHEAEVRSAIANMLSEQLPTFWGLLETTNLRFEVDREASASEPLVLQNLNVITFWRSCLAILLTTGGGSSGRSSALDICAPGARPETPVLLMLGNDLVLRRLVCPSILQAFELTSPVDDLFDFTDTEARLREPVAVNDFLDHRRVDQTTLNSLELTVSGDQIAIEGSVWLTGTGWGAIFSFSGSVVVEISDEGHPEFHSEMTTALTDFTFSAWVWALGMWGQGHTLAGIAGQLASHCFNRFFQIAFAEWLRGAVESLFPEPDVPTPALPFSLEISEALWDDLSFYGWPRFSEQAPEHVGPEVWIDGEFEVTEAQGSETEQMVVCKVVKVVRTTFTKAHYGAFRARMRRLVAPLQYSWSLGGMPLEGESSVEMGDAEISFSVQGDRCELWVGSGDSLNAELRVEVEDARGAIVPSPPRTLTVEGTLDSMGVSGAEVIMGPIVEILQTEPNALVNELASRGLIDPGESRPDESLSTQPSRATRTEAFRAALGRGMDMDLSDLPFDG